MGLINNEPEFDNTVADKFKRQMNDMRKIEIEEDEEEVVASEVEEEESHYAHHYSHIDEKYYGTLIHLEEGKATTQFKPLNNMVVDDYGLIHSGIIDNAAQICALLSINQPYMRIVQTSTEALSPAKRGMIITFEAHIHYDDVDKKTVKVSGKCNGLDIYKGTIYVHQERPKTPIKEDIDNEEELLEEQL